MPRGSVGKNSKRVYQYVWLVANLLNSSLLFSPLDQDRNTGVSSLDSRIWPHMDGLADDNVVKETCSRQAGKTNSSGFCNDHFCLLGRLSQYWLCCGEFMQDKTIGTFGKGKTYANIGTRPVF